jgi:hypothetical protein
LVLLFAVLQTVQLQVNAHVQRLIDMAVTCEHMGETTNDDSAIVALNRRIAALRSAMEHLAVTTVGVGDRARDMESDSLHLSTAGHLKATATDDLEKWVKDAHYPSHSQSDAELKQVGVVSENYYNSLFNLLLN